MYRLDLVSTVPYFQGFGVSIEDSPSVHTISIDPRGGFELDFVIEWSTKRTLRIELPEWVGRSFDAQRALAVSCLQGIDSTRAQALNTFSRAVDSLAHWSLTISKEAIVLRLAEKPKTDVIAPLIAVASAFVPFSSTELKRLTSALRLESNPAVRRHDLSCLIARYPNDPDALAAVQYVAHDLNGWIRIDACRAVRFAPPLRDLVLSPSFAEHEMKVEALHAFAAVANEQERLSLFERVALGRDVSLAAVALDLLDKETAAIAIWLKVLGAGNEELALTAVSKLRLQSAQSREVEPKLIALLETKLSERVHQQICHTLGEVGTRASIIGLTAALKRSRFDRTAKRATKDALERLKSRLGDAASGALSVTSEGGEVSVSGTPLFTKIK